MLLAPTKIYYLNVREKTVLMTFPHKPKITYYWKSCKKHKSCKILSLIRLGKKNTDQLLMVLTPTVCQFRCFYRYTNPTVRVYFLHRLCHAENSGVFTPTMVAEILCSLPCHYPKFMAARRAYMLRRSIGLSLFRHVKDKSNLHMLNLHCYHYEKNVSSRLQEIMQPFFF